MVLEALEKILDINFQPNIDISNVSLINYESRDKLQKEGDSLKINISELSEKERKELLDVPPEQFEIQGRVLDEKEESDVNAIEQGYDESSDEITGYFDGILSENYISIVDASLYLRALIDEKDITRDEIHERKKDIAKKYGPDAFYLSSLVTAGYFDPDGGVRDIYVGMELNDQYDRYKFQERLEELVDNKLLCVFVENDDSVHDVTQETIQRLARYQREEPVNEWLDMRGIGDQCEEIIDGVLANLEEEYIGIDYDRWSDGEDLYVRIHPHSLPDITS